MALLKAETKNGWVEGLPSSNQRISLFKGIPFAAPPVGDLRWKAPRPAESWDGVLKAYKFADIAMQERFASEGGNVFARDEFYVHEYPINEDCLYLNVWTPVKSAGEKLPVAVYFHGGGFRTGYSYLNAYDGDGFAKRGMVVVTLAYRLNVFGFLAHPELTAEDPNGSSGNYGPLDMVAGLKWVKENIAAFGGDPEDIGIFGQSAGGMSVRLMSVTPLTKGYFKRAIIQSGGGMMYPLSLSNHRTLSESEKQGEEFFEFLGVKNVKEARSLTGKQVLDGLIRFDEEVHRFVNAPNVDGYLLPRKEVDICRRGEHHDVDYMLGCTKDELDPVEPMPSKEKIIADAIENYGEYADKYLEIVKPDAKEFYQLEIYNKSFAEEMLAGALSWCENQNKIGLQPAYMYYFTLVPPGNEVSFHSAEHHYVFQTLVRSNLPYTGRDFDLSNTLADYWANFLKTGNPNGEGLPTWTPYTEKSPKAMDINYNLQMIKVPEKPHVKFMKEYAINR